MIVAHQQDERQDCEILTSINPNHENFNFDVWAKMVKHQMLTVIQNNLSSKKSKTVCVDLAENMSESSRNKASI
jgi:hypothetical protein